MYSNLEALTCSPFACRPRSSGVWKCWLKTGRTKSFYVREAILRQIEDIEDYYLARRRLARGGPRVAMESLERRVAPKAKTK